MWDTKGIYNDSVPVLTDLRTFDEVAQFISKHIDKNPFCIETGTAYGFPPENPYWNTTPCIVKRICEPHNGQLISIDLEDRSENINKLFAFGDTDLNRVRLLKGNSLDVLRNLSLSKLDLLCLDSGEDEDLLLNEYLIVQHFLSEKHYILVDDIHNQNSVKYKKIVPLLKELGYDWVQIPTETGLFVSAKGYPVPRKLQ